MSFDTDRAALVQEQFTVLEIDLPELTDECALPDGSGTGYGTPRTCSQTWNETDFKTYFFATQNTPLEYGRPRTSAGLPGDVIEMPDNVYRAIQSIDEAPAELKPGQGLAARLRLTIRIKDFLGNPGPREGAYDSAEGTLTLVVGDRVVVAPDGAAGGTVGNIYTSITVTGSTNLATQDYSVGANWSDGGAFTPKASGTFFGKLEARNVVTNKTIRIKYFYVQADGVYAESDAQVRTYTGESLRNNGNGTYTLAAIDELVKLDADKSQFPEATNGTVRVAVNDSTTTIPVDATTDWEKFSVPYLVRIGSELLKATAVNSNQTASATLTVATRGADISLTNFITRTTADDHDAGDEVQICQTADAVELAVVLGRILAVAGLSGGSYGTDEGTVTLIKQDTVEVETGHAAGGTVGNAYRSLTVEGSTDLTAEDYSVGANWENLGIAVWAIVDWKAETDAWLSGVTLNTTWHDSKKANDTATALLNDFLFDMWYDSIDRQVKISAISVWKASSITLEVGKHINRDSLKVTQLDSKRVTQAFVHFNKPFKVENDDIKQYREIALQIDANLESAGLFGEPKIKQLASSPVLDTTRAVLLVQRWVSRFGEMPLLYRWNTEEKFLNFITGQVVDIVGDEIQNFDGSAKTIRAQILSIKPRHIDTGRTYPVRAMTYEPAFSDGEEFTITGPANNINLFIQAGAPATAVTVTFLLDGDIFGSTSPATASIVAGAFPSGSHIDIVLQNGANLQARGGNGGRGGNTVFESSSWIPEDGDPGGDGGLVYDAQGVDTDIYLSGTFSGNVADGSLRAPGGGGGGEDAVVETAGDGGGGGAGSNVGPGGPGGRAVGDPSGVDGNDGSNGTTTGIGGARGGVGAGNGGVWGVDGNAGDQAAGVAGRGLEDGGATLNLKVDVYYLSSIGNQNINTDDSVEVAGGHGAGGVVGDVYKSLSNRGVIDLSAENYANASNWSREFISGGGDTPASIAA